MIWLSLNIGCGTPKVNAWAEYLVELQKKISEFDMYSEFILMMEMESWFLSLLWFIQMDFVPVVWQIAKSSCCDQNCIIWHWNLTSFCICCFLPVISFRGGVRFLYKNHYRLSRILRLFTTFFVSIPNTINRHN